VNGPYRFCGGQTFCGLSNLCHVLHLNELVQAASRLSQAQVDILLEMVEALSSPIDQMLHPNSDFVDAAFAEQFSNRLRIHHATTSQKFKKKAFEYAFVEAARRGGHEASLAASATTPGADTVRGGVRFSLKTEASINISINSITISKFSEARWIRECRSPLDFCRGVQSRIPRHLSEYDRIITLRAIDQGSGCVRYDLVEIPIEVLRRVETLTPEDFSPRTKHGSSSAAVFDLTGHRLFRIRLDGSVEKVTISGLPVSACVIHASWIVSGIHE
jgi:hypothetical protein